MRISDWSSDVCSSDLLPGNHHLYITFRTDHPDVRLAEHLRAKYPNEMTIVIQYQFLDLELDEAAFAVSLSFNDVRERLYIPFEAVTAFDDPTVSFGLPLQQHPAEQRTATRHEGKAWGKRGRSG